MFKLSAPSTDYIRHPAIKAMVFLLLPFIVSSCSTFDPPLVVPAYGHIDSVNFTVPTDSLSWMGTASSNIQYVWVYLDDNPVGAFQLPCTFPMIASNGVHNIKIYPGVTPVGITSPAAIYPFYQFYSVNVTLQQGSTYKFQPTSVYYTWAKFPYLENFDAETPDAPPREIINFYGNGNSSAATTTTMIVTDNPKLVFDGHGNSGMVVVSPHHDYYIGVTNPPQTLPNSSTPVYIELNYRCTTEFTIGMFEGDTTDQSSPIAVVYPAPTWTKMYVSMNSTLQQLAAFSSQEIYFTMSRDSADQHNTDTLLLDNIKILD